LTPNHGSVGRIEPDDLDRNAAAEMLAREARRSVVRDGHARGGLEVDIPTCV